MKFLWWFALGIFSWAALLCTTYGVWAQQAPASCEEKLDQTTFQAGGLMQQLAVVTAQLRAMTKERDDAKAALVKASPPTEKKPEKAPAKQP